MTLQLANVSVATLLGFLSLLLLSISKPAFASPVTPQTRPPYLAGLLCTRNPEWTTPPFVASARSDCPAAFLELEFDEVMGYPDILRQYLPVGVRPSRGVPVVHTPYKIQKGPCTLAVTTLRQLSELKSPTPEIGPGPFPLTDQASWLTLLRKATLMQEDCIDMRRPAAGVYAAGVMEGLGLFMYGSGSSLDQKIGPAATQLILPFQNVTNGRVTPVVGKETARSRTELLSRQAEF